MSVKRRVTVPVGSSLTRTSWPPPASVAVACRGNLGRAARAGPGARARRGLAPIDPRASSQSNLVLEFLGDSVYAVAGKHVAASVWNDVREGADCPAIDVWRAGVQTATPRTNDAFAAVGSPELAREPFP